MLSVAPLVYSETMNWNRNTYNVPPIPDTENFKICDNATWYLYGSIGQKNEILTKKIPLMKCFDYNRSPLVVEKLRRQEAIFKKMD